MVTHASTKDTVFQRFPTFAKEVETLRSALAIQEAGQQIKGGFIPYVAACQNLMQESSSLRAAHQELESTLQDLSQRVNAAWEKAFPTELELAFQADDVKTLEKIAKVSALQKAKLSNGELLLHLAIRQGKEKIVQFLLETLHLDTSTKDHQGLSAMDHALLTENPKMIALVLGLQLGTQIPETALSQKSTSQEKKTCAVLRNLSFLDMQKLRHPPVSRLHPLHAAAFLGEVDQIESLLSHVSPAKRKEFLNSVDANGMSALHFAIVNGHLDVVKFLLKEGIQIDEKMINGMTALHLAVISATGSKELIEELMKTGKFDPNATDLLGRTPLHFALISENLSNAKALIQKGGDLFSKSSQIITPFAFFKTLIEIRKSQRDPLPLSRFSLFPLCALTAGRICSFLGYRDAANGLGTLATYGLMVRNILFSDSVPERLSGFIGIGSPNFGNVVATGSLWKAFIHQARLAWKNRHLKGYRPLRNVVVSGMNALLSTWHGLDLLDPTLLCPFKTESACLKSLDTKYESHKAWIRDYFKKQYPDATNLDQLYRKASLGRHPDQCELSSKTDCSEIFPKIAAAFGR